MKKTADHTGKREDMSNTTDHQMLLRIQALVSEEQGLYRRGTIGDKDRVRLDTILAELDHDWRLLEHRRALRECGKDPDRVPARYMAAAARHAS